MKSWRDVLDIPEPPAELVARLHDEASPRITRALSEHAAKAGSLAPDDERALGRHVIQGVLADWRAAAYRDGTTGLSPDDEAVLARAVHDQIYALGALQPCIDHPDVSDVHVSGHERTFVLLRDGTKLVGPPAAASDTELIAMLTRAARRAGRSERRFDREEVSLDLQLPGGARLHALREVTGRPVVDIRCHKWEIVSLDQLLKDHEIDRAICDFLAAAVLARRNRPEPGAEHRVAVLCERLGELSPLIARDVEVAQLQEPDEVLVRREAGQVLGGHLPLELLQLGGHYLCGWPEPARAPL
jgi:pilus assembly protein CpaF